MVLHQCFVIIKLLFPQFKNEIVIREFCLMEVQNHYVTYQF